MKTAVKAGAYAAPVVLAASVPNLVSAAASVVPTSTVTTGTTGTLTITPGPTGAQGQVFTVTLTGFRPNATIGVTIVDPSGNVIQSSTANTNAAGTAFVTFRSNGAALGTFRVIATDGSAQTVTTFTVTAAQPVTVRVLIQQRAGASGSGTVNETVTASLMGAFRGASYEVRIFPNNATGTPADGTLVGTFTTDPVTGNGSHGDSANHHARECPSKPGDGELRECHAHESSRRPIH